MGDYKTLQGVDEVQPTLPSSGYALSLDNVKYQPRKSQDWLYEFLAWLPFGLLFLALLDRTSGPDEMARLIGELGANVNSARSTEFEPRAPEPPASHDPEQRVAF
jgi:hypothetical protein